MLGSTANAKGFISQLTTIQTNGFMLAKLVCAIIPGQKENPRVGVRTVREGQRPGGAWLGPPVKDLRGEH